MRIDGEKIFFDVDKEGLKMAIRDNQEVRQEDFEFKESIHTNDKRPFKVDQKKIREKTEKYRNYLSITLPPSKEGKVNQDV